MKEGRTGERDDNIVGKDDAVEQSESTPTYLVSKAVLRSI
jgi:hypothetical protein